jgi:hypothetical protein
MAFVKTYLRPLFAQARHVAASAPSSGFFIQSNIISGKAHDFSKELSYIYNLNAAIRIHDAGTNTCAWGYAHALSSQDFWIVKKMYKKGLSLRGRG